MFAYCVWVILFEPTVSEVKLGCPQHSHSRRRHYPQRPRYGVSFGVGGRLTDTQNVVQLYNGALSARKNTILSVELKVTVLYKS